MAETLTTTPTSEMPTDLAEAHRWITTLQQAYHRELRYRERLENRLNQQNEVVYRALAWRRARGMHIKPALLWLKGVTDQLLERERSGEYSPYG